MAQKIAAVLAFLRNLFAREELPPPAEAAAPASRPPLARWLFASEPLPEEKPLERGRRGVARLLLSPEPLEELPPRPRAGASQLRALLAPEPLPELPPSPRRARGRWLRWLFAPERLDAS